MDFGDAKSKLGAFTLHGEARKGRWGILGDVMFMRLSTDVVRRAQSQKDDSSGYSANIPLVQ
jgi:hypothetical protein